MADPKKTPTAKDDGLDDIHPLARPFLFLSNPGFVKNFQWIVLALLLVFVVLGFIYLSVGEGEKAHSPFENPFAYWMFGFFGFAFAVLCGWPLRKLLMRDEDYYGDDDA